MMSRCCCRNHWAGQRAAGTESVSPAPPHPCLFLLISHSGSSSPLPTRIPPLPTPGSCNTLSHRPVLPRTPASQGNLGGGSLRRVILKDIHSFPQGRLGAAGTGKGTCAGAACVTWSLAGLEGNSSWRQQRRKWVRFSRTGKQCGGSWANPAPIGAGPSMTWGGAVAPESQAALTPGRGRGGLPGRAGSALRVPVPLAPSRRVGSICGTSDVPQQSGQPWPRSPKAGDPCAPGMHLWFGV